MTAIPPVVPPVRPTDVMDRPRRDDLMPGATPDPDVNWDIVAKAHVRSVDALAGFDAMVDKAEPRFRPVALRFQALHRRHAAALARILSDAGQVPDTDGSFMASVNRAVVATRAFFDDVDEDVMDAVRRGERNVLRAFEEALDQPLPVAARGELARMLAELNDLLAETRHLD